MNNRRKILASVAIFLVVFLVGVAGFKLLGGPDWSLLDAVYMTAITISTIGYGEVNDLSANPAARVFAVFFIIVSLGTIAFAVSSITAFIVEGELKDILGRKRMEKEIAGLRGHYIVCGADETAETIVLELSRTGRDFVVVEASEERLKLLAESLARPEEVGGRAGRRLLYVAGDPAEDAVLLKAGIERAAGIFLSLPSDEANLFVTMTARGLSPNVRIVTKGIDVKSHAKMKKAGADSVVSPTFIGGMRMASEMVRPAAATFLDTMLRDRDKGLRVEEMPVEPGSALEGKTVREARLEDKTGALLVAVKNADTGAYEFKPAGERKLRAGEILIYIGNPEATARLREVAVRKS
jgi:voltage-gated potassium channel